MSEEECQDLAVYHDRKDGGRFISRWKVSDEDLVRIAETREVWVWIIGASHPPIYIGTEDPFEKETGGR
jgi:hypothetical protein